MGILRSDRVSGLGGANAINGSVEFTGTRYAESYFDLEASTDFAFGTGDFTVECWINLIHDTADNYYKRIYMTDGPTGNASGNFQIAIVPTTGVVNLWEDSGDLDVSGSTKVTKAGWVHIAAVRSGSGSNNLKLYVNGVQDLQTTYTTSISPNSGNPRPRIGAYSKDNGGSIPGHVSNLRVSNEALYTAAFTPPTTRLTKLSNTVLLCFQSPGNIVKEETGKILVPTVSKTASNFPKASRLAPDKGEDHGTTFADGAVFDTLSYMVPPGGTTAQSNRGRGLFGGGILAPSPSTAEIQYLQIQSQGNAVNFGSLTVARTAVSGSGNSTRGIFSGGTPNKTEIDYVTISTTANAVDFGDLTVGRGVGNGCASSSTRGISGWGGSTGSNSDVIDYVTIASAGNATDFGDTVGTARRNTGQASSPTRGVRGGGYTSSGVDNIDYITIATTGDSQDFGDLTAARYGCGAASNNTRCIWGGGGPTAVNTMDYVTIASTGNATDYGDLTSTRIATSALSNSIRGVWAGGYTPTFVNTMDYATIATTGNASDFGDAVNKHRNMGAVTDSHGGLS